MSPIQQQRRYGTVEQLDDGRWQLRFTRTLPYPKERVWRAITEPEQLAHWFPTTIEGERAAGAPLRFAFPNNQAPPMDGEVLAYQPESFIELRWGSDVLRLELQSVENGTELTLLDLLEERGKAARDGAGWHVCLDALERQLDGVEVQRPHEPDEWRVHYEEYERRGFPTGAAVPETS
jgi:uncharacterized protein YndB with AHSA1/START domain